jgi:2'-5' RNA ligase
MAFDDDAQAPRKTLPTELGVLETWHRGRPKFTAWVLSFEPGAAASVLSLRMHQVRSALAPWLWTNHARAPHITLRVCGFWSSDYAPSDLVVDRHALACADLRAFHLEIGGAGWFASSPYLRVGPAGVDEILRLRSVLETVRAEERTVPFVPHVSVGTFRREADASDIDAALAPLLALPPLRFSVRALHLVSYRTHELDGPLLCESSWPLSDVPPDGCVRDDEGTKG